MIEQFKQLPRSMQVLMGTLAGAAIFAFAWVIYPRAVLIMLVGVLVIVAVLLLWFWYQRRKTRERTEALTSRISMNADAPINVVSKRAELETLQTKFKEGVETLHAAGKDLYSLPWYVVCGEPGSGKTEAVRRCGVGFPPGLHEDGNEMQGTGGTLNMHWWFTNHAVLLDTAGRILFKEAPPGTTTEWTAFLDLLKNSRPNCPINGLLLVIPAESLIKDSSEKIDEKAAKIARQLERIQRTLKVRFPVFVLITKCDLINGFREFFAGIKDAQLQHQIMGWSNPDPLDAEFEPEAVDRHLGTIVQRISRRRLGLLRDPISQEGMARRIDEVDSLFSLPTSVAALGPPLRRYLQAIFVAGPVSPKPLFLRGIYFTSAITEGSALDLEIAAALNLPVDKLPEGKAWVRERSFFLRDLFQQKIFKERGLVTHATNTRKQRRSRRMKVASVVVVGLLVFLSFSIFARHELRTTIAEERNLWTFAAAGWEGNQWRAIVKPLFQGSLKYRYTGAQEFGIGDEKDISLEPLHEDQKKRSENRISLVEVHEALKQRAARPIRVPLVFKPMETLVMGANTKRREAQRVVFEASVVLPLLEAARIRLERTGEPWIPGGERQLALLVQLEGLIHLRGVEGYVNEMSADEFLGPLLTPWLGAAPIPDLLVGVFDWTNYGGGHGKGQWPGQWLSKGNRLRENRPIRNGLDGFAEFLDQEQTARLSGLGVVREGRLAAGAFLNAERDFQRIATAPRNYSGWADELARSFATVEERQQTLFALIAKAGTSGKFGAEGFSMAGGYTTLVQSLRQQGSAATAALSRVLDRQKLAAEKAEAVRGSESEFTLFSDVRRRLQEIERSLAGMTEQAFSAPEQAELATLDAAVFDASVDRTQRQFAYRCGVYGDAVGLLSPASGETSSIIGQLAECVAQIGSRQDLLRQRIDKYSGAGREEFQRAARLLLSATGEVGQERIADMYIAAVDRIFETQIGYPLVRTSRNLSPDELKALVAVVSKVRVDVVAPGLSAPVKKRLEASTARMMQIEKFAASLVSGPDKAPIKFRILFPSQREQWKVLDSTPATARPPFAREAYRTVRIGADVRRLPWDEGDPSPLLDKLVSDPLPLIEFFENPDGDPNKKGAYAKHDFDGGDWGVLRALEGGARRHKDGKKWDLVLTLQGTAGRHLTVLTLDFDTSLPPVEEWPR